MNYDLSIHPRPYVSTFKWQITIAVLDSVCFINSNSIQIQLNEIEFNSEWHSTCCQKY